MRLKKRRPPMSANIAIDQAESLVEELVALNADTAHLLDDLSAVLDIPSKRKDRRR